MTNVDIKRYYYIRKTRTNVRILRHITLTLENCGNKIKGHRCKRESIKETLMKLNYTKTVLYAYANIEEVKEQIDDFVERKALSSMSDYSPCIEQCEKILNFTAQKIALIELKEMVKKALAKLTEFELDCLDYKYFRQKPKQYFIGFDYESRNYFRRQVLLAKKVSNLFEKVGLTDVWFEKNCLNTSFFVELLKRVEIYEKQSRKNKSKKEKLKENLVKIRVSA